MSLKTRTVEQGEPLTWVEIRAIGMAAQGVSNPRMADLLDQKMDTVKTHLRRAFVKLGALDRAHAVSLCYAQGLLMISPTTGAVRVCSRANGCHGRSHSVPCLRAAASANPVTLVTAHRVEVEQLVAGHRTIAMAQPDAIRAAIRILTDKGWGSTKTGQHLGTTDRTVRAYLAGTRPAPAAVTAA